jgi:hypothetical protein
MYAGHGPNIGHGYVKYVVIDDHGRELEPVVFPAMIARADRGVAGALASLPTVDVGIPYWTGDDALHGMPKTMLAQDRLLDRVFIPALVRGAMQRFGPTLNGAASGACVSGLPATWAQDQTLAEQLGARLRSGASYRSVRVIAEPLGVIYARLLDTDGAIAGDAVLQHGTVGVVDLGHHTVDVCVVRAMKPQLPSLQTYQLGTAQPLGQIRAQLSARFERDLSLVEVDRAVREGALTVAGQPRPLPAGWDRPLRDNAAAIVTALVEAWRSGADLDLVLVAGGGAELPQLAAAIRTRFPHAEVAEAPQLAIARGYARLARRLGRTA